MGVIEYIKIVWFSVLYSTAAKTIALYCLLTVISILYSCKPQKAKYFAIALVVSILQAVPIFFPYYLTCPESLDILTHALFIFANPLLVFVMYALLRRSVGMPTDRCADISKKAISYMNVSLSVFLAVQEILLNNVEWTILEVDYFAIAAAILFTLLVVGLSYSYIIRHNIRVRLPDEPDVSHRKLLWAFLELLSVYGFLVLFRMIFVTPSATTPYEIRSHGFHFIGYAVLVIIWITYFILEIYRDMLKAKVRESENLLTHIAALDAVNEQYRGIKHDIGNMLQTYGQLIEEGDLVNLRNYHQSVFRTTEKAATHLDLSQKLSHYMPLYALFVTKADLAAASDVDMQITADKIAPNLAISDIDLCRILGNLLDNAIEAAAESSRHKIVVSIESSDDSAIFIVSNSCDVAVKLKRIYDKGYTTKESGRGFGLYEVDKLIRQNESVALFVNQHGNMVTFYLEIDYAMA